MLKNPKTNMEKLSHNGSNNNGSVASVKDDACFFTKQASSKRITPLERKNCERQSVLNQTQKFDLSESF